MNSLHCLLVLSALLGAGFATEVDQCPGMEIANLKEHAHLTPCKHPPCKLKKGSRTSIAFEFTPEKDLMDVRNHVEADVFGISLPFVGVDGISVCDKIFLAETPETKASCPLKAGTSYIYKDSFPVLAIYPTLNTRIHWALRSGKKDVTCFEVDAKIVG